MNDIDHPAHYGGKGDPYEAIKVIEAWSTRLCFGLAIRKGSYAAAHFCYGTTLKYLARAGQKPGEDVVKDLKKAGWYLDRLIAKLEEGGKDA